MRGHAYKSAEHAYTHVQTHRMVCTHSTTMYRRTHTHTPTHNLSRSRAHTHLYLPSPIRICICSHQYANRTSTHPHTHYDTRRCIGCFKLQVIFRKRATNCRALLRKMTYEDKASYGFSPPCTWESVSGCVFMDIYILLHVYMLVLQQHWCVWTYICILFTSVYMYTDT